MYHHLFHVQQCSVALRKESVDRNGCLLDWDAIGYTSLSARRAWIETLVLPDQLVKYLGRSPQGERG